MATADQRKVREAAERIERAVERYGEGDHPAAQRELEAALALDPGCARARVLHAWVRDLVEGRRSLDGGGGLDEDALQAVADALPFDDGDEELTRERRGPMAPASEAGWDPVPLDPGPAAPSPREEAPRRPTAPTLPGVQPVSLDLPRLTPRDRASALYPTDENTASRTREWRGTPTGTNLPPLDVPELTDDQVQELLALALEPGEEAPKLLEIEAEPTPLPHRNPLTVEMEAEPTPPPHRNPLVEAPPLRSTTMPDATPPVPPELALAPGFEHADVDPFEQTPTRERRDVLKAALADEADEAGSSPTNPFVRRRLAEYSGLHPVPAVDELPLPPGAAAEAVRERGEAPAAPASASIEEALARGDVAAAIEAAEALLATAGGIGSDGARPHEAALARAYEAAVAPLDRVPMHGQATPDLDPRSAFLLSRLDGSATAEDLLDVSGMPRLEALRLLALLVRRGVVVFR